MSKIPSIKPYGVTPDSTIRPKTSQKYSDCYKDIKGFNGSGQVNGWVRISYKDGKRIETRMNP